MKDIYCFKYTEGTGAVELVGIVDDYQSFTFQRSYSGIGEWQLVISGYSKNAGYLKSADFIRAGEGVAGMISKHNETRNSGENTITFNGLELKGLAKKRIVIPPTGQSHQSYSNVSPEYIVANLLNTQIVNASAARKIYGTIAAYNESTTSITYEGRFSALDEVIVGLCETYQIGWYADIEDGGIVWHIYHGIDRKASQAQNSRLIMSYDYDSMSGATYELARHKANTALVAGQGEGVERSTVLINNTNTGLNRTEVYIDARDIEDDTLLPQRGQEKLAEYGNTDVFEAVPARGYFTNNYRETYDLGDIGTLKEMAVDFRLTEITEVYENNEFNLNFVFGYDAAKLASTLKRMNSNAEALVALEGGGTTLPENVILYDVIEDD